MHRSVIETIGHTPLIRLRRASEETGCDILGKAEFMNPGQSVKDRAGLFIIRDAEEKNLLTRGQKLVEPTSGNTGMGIAFGAIGALVYCDHARSAGTANAVMPILLAAAGEVRFRLQKVLLRYYLEQFPAAMAGPAIATLSAGSGIGRFVREVRDGRSWSQADITEGLVQIDLFGVSQERTFWDNTPHAEVGRLVTAAAQEYLRICGAYTNGVRS